MPIYIQSILYILLTARFIYFVWIKYLRAVTGRADRPAPQEQRAKTTLFVSDTAKKIQAVRAKYFILEGVNFYALLLLVLLQILRIKRGGNRTFNVWCLLQVTANTRRTIRLLVDMITSSSVSFGG